MNLTDDQRLRQRLHEEFGALEISPAPVLRVTGRGRGVRARRRALAAGTVIAVALAVAAAAQLNRARHQAHGHAERAQPRPRRARCSPRAPPTGSPGPWRCATSPPIPARAGASPGSCSTAATATCCSRRARGRPSATPPSCSSIPGFPGVGAVFTQVAPEATRLVATFPGGRQVSVRPVWVSACTQRFHLAGFAYAEHGPQPSEIATYDRFGLGDGLVISPGRPEPGRPHQSRGLGQPGHLPR